MWNMSFTAQGMLSWLAAEAKAHTEWHYQQSRTLNKKNLGKPSILPFSDCSPICWGYQLTCHLFYRETKGMKGQWKSETNSGWLAGCMHMQGRSKRTEWKANVQRDLKLSELYMCSQPNTDLSAEGKNHTGSQCLSTISNQSLADHWGMWMQEPQEARLKHQKEEETKKGKTKLSRDICYCRIHTRYNVLSNMPIFNKRLWNMTRKQKIWPTLKKYSS